MMIRLHELWVRFITRSFTVLARRSFGSFGAGSVIRPPASIHGQDRIHVGSGVYIGPGSWLLALTDRPGQSAGFIRIGDGSSFSGGLTVTSLAGVCIGQKVLIGRNVHISDHAHRHDMPDMPVIDQGLTPPRQVVIGHGSWIGQGVVICPGVNIGRNSVIGANSVVRADIPDHCLAAGIPARVIRRLPAAATMDPSID